MLLEPQANWRENRWWTGVLSSLLYPGYKEWDKGLVGHLLIGWGMYTGWGKIRANTFSLWGRRGDRLYCSINSYNMGAGRTTRIWFFCCRIPRPSLVLSAFSSLGHHKSDMTERLSLHFSQILENPQSDLSSLSQANTIDYLFLRLLDPRHFQILSKI